MIAHGADLTVIENDDHIRILHRGDSLGDDQLGGAGDMLGKGLTDGCVGAGIHSGGGVVQDQDPGLLQQRTGDTQTLFLTAGNIGAALLDIGIIPIGEGFNEIMGAGQLAGVDQFFIGGIGIAPAEIFLDGAGEQHIFLQDHGHIVTQNLQVIVPHVHTADFQCAFGHIVQSGDQLDKGGFTGTGTAQDTNGGAGGDMQIHFLQRPVLGGGGIAEGYAFKVDGAIGHFGDGIGGGSQVRLFSQQLIAAAHGGAGHGHHNEYHTHTHQRREDLGSISKHGGQAAGGQTVERVIAGGYHQMGAYPRDAEHTNVDAGHHHRGVQRKDLFGFGEGVGQIFGDVGEFFRFPLFPDEGFDHPDAVDIFLHHIVQLIQHFEALIKDLEDHGGQADQGYDQNGHHLQVDGAQLGGDLQGHHQRQYQHHHAADGHTDHHLEGHLQVGHIAGEAGDDGGGGEFIDIGETEVLHTIEHIVAEIFCKTGGGFGGENGGCHAKAQAHQGADHQLQRTGEDNVHILQFHTPVVQILHYQGDQHFHGDFANHTQGAENGGPFIFPDAPGQSSDHRELFLLLVWATQGAPHIFNGTVKKRGEEPTLLRGKTLNHTVFDLGDGLLNGGVASLAFGQQVKALAAAVLRIGAKLQKAFLFHSAESTPYAGVAQMEEILDIFGTRGRFGPGDETDDPALGGRQVHLCQGGGDHLLGTPMQHPETGAVEIFHGDTS